jgi:hypothetical protein
MARIASQLQLVGLEETRRLVEQAATTRTKRARNLRRVETTHDILSALPSPDELGFLHAGLCQTFLPHSRPQDNLTPWRRQSGKFSLIVSPGVFDTSLTATRSRQPTPKERDQMYVGVPYGAKARLILIHLQTEGLRSRVVSLGPNLSAFMRSLGLPVTGGPRGTIPATKEQCLRIARCTFSMQWSDRSAEGDERTIVTDTRIVDGMDLWQSAKGDEWTGSVELSAKFHEHLREHAVPLDKRALSGLAGNSFGLDLYALLVYRLPRLKNPVHIRWEGLQGQIGAEYADKHMLARRVRETLPVVMDHYPHANVEVLPTGLTLRPSKPAVPSTLVHGFRMIETNQ